MEELFALIDDGCIMRFASDTEHGTGLHGESRLGTVDHAVLVVNDENEDTPTAERLAQAHRDPSFIDVVHAMTRLKAAIAPTLVGQHTVPALNARRAGHTL
ncbi:hypothetical protein ACFY2N_22400 [Streptomyces rubiginosohelvolus]|uniref:hypothetical protein n=1 Tax=Streptomyces rubiginosohelvolus TaxID=67362 RepID=UPI00369D8358